MKVLVTFAVKQEFAPWRVLRRFRRLQAEEFPAFETRIGDAQVTVVLTGMGMQHAEQAARDFLLLRPEACISAGLAGGLRPEHRSGRILSARTVRTGSGELVVGSDSRLRRLAAVCGARAVESFYCSEHVVSTVREKAMLSLLADAVEMESFAILSEAEKMRVPALAVRVVGDACEDDLPLDFSRATGKRGHISVTRLIGQIARRPQRLPALIRLGGESRRACTKLAAFLDSYVETLGDQNQAMYPMMQKATG